MKVQILGCGTSTGVPIPGCPCEICNSKNTKNKRYRTSAIIKLDNNKNILIDAGPDLRQQSLRFKINTIDAVLFTHPHADHILGIEDLRGFTFRQSQPIPIYGTKETLDDIKKMFYYIFNPPSNYKGGKLVQLSPNQIEHNSDFEIESIKFQCLKVMHGEIPVTCFKTSNFAYVTDCNSIPKKTYKELKNLDLLILDGLREESHNTHFSIPEAVNLAQELNAKKTYLIHMTHTVDYDKVMSKLPDNIELAYDGLEIDI